MGIDTTIYLEPYIKVKNITYTDIVKEEVCEIHGKQETDFCPICGNKILEVERTKTFHMALEEVLENCDNEMTMCSEGDYTYIFDNGMMNEKYRVEDENEMVDIKCEDILKQIEDFKNTHKENISKIQKHSKEKIEIKFGHFKHVYF